MVIATAVRLASRMADLGTESAFEVLARARQLEREGHHIIHMEIGEPDFPTPQHVKDAANDALAADETKYGPSAGIMPCREAVADYVSETHGVPITPEQVVITPGAKPPIFYATLALVDEGDEVLLPDPGFPIYESVVAFVGGRPISVPLSEANEFRFEVAELERRITSRTKMIVLNSPQNPTGSVLTAEDVAGIAHLAREHDLWVISDEIYSRLLFEGDAPSILSEPGMAERTVLVDGFSKAYSMTGWRLGYGVMPEDVAEAPEETVEHQVDGVLDLERGGVDALLHGEEERSADPPQERADRERDDPKPRDVDSDGGGEVLVLLERPEEPAEPAVDDAVERDERPDREQGREHEEGDVGVHFREVRDQGEPEHLHRPRERHVQDPLGAVRHRRERLGGEAGRLRQAQGHHREVDALEPEDRKADRAREQGGDQAREGERHPEREPELGDRDGRRVLSEEGERALSDVDPADVEHEPDPGGDDAQRRGLGKHADLVRPVAYREGHPHEPGEDDGDDDNGDFPGHALRPLRPNPRACP